MATLLEADRVLCSADAPAMQGGAVMVERERIRAVGRRDDFGHPEPGVEVYRFPGATLMPGLIDLHVHMGGLGLEDGPDPGGDLSRLRRGPAWLAVAAAHRLTAALQRGVTTVRDVGSQYDVGPTLKFAVMHGLVEGSRPFVARNTICQTGGHTSDLPGLAREANGAEDVRLAVREQIRGGADLIKLTTSGRRGFPEFTLEELSAAVDEAHRSGFRVACHASILPAVRAAVQAGVDTIEHCCEVDDAVIDRIVRQQITVIPTALAFASIVEQWERFKHNAFHRNIPARWKSTQESVRALVAAGAKIAVGSDTDQPQAPFAAAAEEARVLTGLGLTAANAVLGATRRAAEALGQDHEFGTLEAGRLADIIAVHGDPTHDIKALGDVRFVMQAGRAARGHAATRG